MDPTATVFLAWGLTVLVSLRFEWEGSRLQYLAVLVGAVTVVASWWLLGDDALGPQTGWAVAVSWLGVVAVVGILALHVHLAPWLDDISDHYAKDVGVVQLRPTRHAVVGGRVGLGLLVALLVVVGFVSQQRWLGCVAEQVQPEAIACHLCGVAAAGLGGQRGSDQRPVAQSDRRVGFAGLRHAEAGAGDALVMVQALALDVGQRRVGKQQLLGGKGRLQALRCVHA